MLGTAIKAAGKRCIIILILMMQRLVHPCCLPNTP
jgi:hypothetical protein